jgi:hypothetical protein
MPVDLMLLLDLPFEELTMPRYRGPIILILGGSAMLAVSLLLSLLLQDRHLNQGNPTHPGPRHSYPHHALMGDRVVRQTPANTGNERPLRLRRRWVRSLRQAARYAGLGDPDHLVAPGGRHALELRSCRTCRLSPDHAGCEDERVLLENTLRRHAPSARVVEVHCDPYRTGHCRFEVFKGGR